MAASCARLLMRKSGSNAMSLHPVASSTLMCSVAALTCRVRWLANEVREPPIPDWEKPKQESNESTKARLLYQSRKRGMSENGLLLGNFASRFLNTLTEDQLHEYDILINKPSNDWDIYNWATGNKPTPPEYDNKVMQLLQEFVSNPNMESRIRQPDLPGE